MTQADIVLVKFPFTHLESTKKRPALLLNQVVLTKKIQIATVAMITSKVDGFKLDGDTHLQDWEEAKLLHPSVVRLSKVASIDLALIEKKLGHLSGRDLGEVKKIFQKLYRFWI